MNKPLMLSLCLLSAFATASMHIDLDCVLRKDGKEIKAQRSMDVIEGENEFDLGDIHCKMTIVPTNKKAIKSDFEMSYHGEIISSPCIIVTQNEKAFLALKKDANNSLHLSLFVKNVEA